MLNLRKTLMLNLQKIKSDFKNFEKIAIRRIALLTFRTTDPSCSYLNHGFRELFQNPAETKIL